MSRVRGDIPGLLRRCSPVRYLGRPAVVDMVRNDGALGIGACFVSRSATDLFLDLTDPTGMDHGARWLAERVGLAVGATAPGWERRESKKVGAPAACWILPWGRDRAFFCSEPPDFIVPRWHIVPGISALTDPAEALALAIEHVAGVKP